MEITTRFNVGEEVLVVVEDKTYNGTVVSINININQVCQRHGYVVQYKILINQNSTRICYTLVTEDKLSKIK